MISEYDFERLMIQQYVLYKKLVQIQDKVNGRNISRSDIILLDDFKKEVDIIQKIMREKKINS
jgi:hypothetical protein